MAARQEKATRDTTGKQSWQTLQFGDIAENLTVRVDPAEADTDVYVGLEHLAPESLHLKTWGTPADVTGQKFVFKKDDIIFGRRRAYQRKLAVAHCDGICSSHAMVLRAKPKVVLPEFLPFFLQSDMFMERAIGISVGSLSPTINWRDLQVQEFPLPPIEEQHRVAELLWAADEVVERWRETLSNVNFAKATVLSTLQCLCSKAVRNKLEEVLDYASDGPFGSKLKTCHYREHGARVVRLQNIGDGVFDGTDRAFISSSYFEEIKRYSVEEGDVLVAGLGDESHPVGRACLLPAGVSPAVNKADCFCLRPKQQVLSSEFLFYYLNCPDGRAQIEALTQGTTRFRINVSNLKSISIPVPTQGAQLEWVRRLQQLDAAGEQVFRHVKLTQQLVAGLREGLLAKESHV